ncbi:5-OH-xanthotoxin synthase-like [Coffea arabica]|uniref:5-OH-xanthotoxin synthase-like n=1 Tax=Coffea arabica TaxID=13443 RepID=A0A6P6T1T1_COFAR|nr:cytochrome P450 71A1-like [Coffea arabica]XP_027102417.1 cytochrome P450 71A1-like [Coffea arabica]
MEILILLVFPISLLLILLLISNKKEKSSTIHHPPGPPRLPFIGNFHQLDTSCLHKYLWKLSQKYGPIMFLKLGSIPTLVISSARLAEEVLKNQDLIFCSRPKMLALQKLTYNGIDIALAPYSQEWREMRKICVIHLLSAKRLQMFRPIREDEVSRMIKKISEQAASTDQVINLSETLVSLACSMICRIAFGKRFDEEGRERRRFDGLIHEAQAMLGGFFFSDYFPSIAWIDKFTGMLARLESIYEKFDSFYQELIDEHPDPNRPKSMDGDIIDLMLQLQQDGSTSFGITMDHIKAMLMNVFFAGTDTSTVTVIWAMTAMMQKPTVMKKLQAEIREIMGKKQMLDEDDVQMLPYLKAVVKETFRLYPAVPLLVPRETIGKCTIDGYDIQPKTLVYVNAWGIARDPDYWENPDEFLPERFLNSTVDVRGQDFQLIPFGAGRRGCPGYPMGLVTVELVLANILHSFDWELPPGMKKEDIDTDALPGLTMNKKNDLWLVTKLHL